MGATARTALLLPLATLAGCARLMGYHPQEWYDARTACREEMNERVPRSESPEVRGAYVEQCTVGVHSRLPITLAESTMRNSKSCPKCRSTDLIEIRQENPYSNNIFAGWTLFSSVKITRRLCGTCGFMEEWIDSADDIAKIKKKYSS